MDMKQVLEHVRGDLRERPDSHFSESTYESSNAELAVPTFAPPSTRLLKRDEVKI